MNKRLRKNILSNLADEIRELIKRENLLEKEIGERLEEMTQIQNEIGSLKIALHHVLKTEGRK